MAALKLSMVVKNMIQYPSVGTNEEGRQMGKCDNLILTGWGYAEYMASAAAALKALNGNADVRGVSRRRLPELMEEVAERKKGDRWPAIYILGVSLVGDPERLAAALGKLKKEGVKVTWISALEMPGDVAATLKGLLDVRVFDLSLLEAVGRSFGVDVDPYTPFVNRERGTAETKAYFSLIAAAQFYYRNYQDESLFAKVVCYMANGVRPVAWEGVVKDAVRHYERYGDRELIGKSHVIAMLQDRINRVAVHDHARVLILGESGTGKETVALQIHNKSPRARTGEFKAFNCASVTKDLLEDRFFGHEKGAFTNAIERTDGLFIMADGGTLFLDEIGEMPLEVQALLLRVLEGGRFMRVGGKEELRCDVRLVTATNRDLPKLVAEGKFREDLYQRLNVVQLRTPSLREHKDDIPIIANAWWRKFHGNRTLSEEQIAALMDYDYPGNVRELINILDRATALEEDDFELLMREHKEMNAGLMGNLELKSGRIPDKLEDAIRLHVRRVYEKYGENLTRAAEALDVSRNTVRKYIL